MNEFFVKINMVNKLFKKVNWSFVVTIWWRQSLTAFADCQMKATQLSSTHRAGGRWGEGAGRAIAPPQIVANLEAKHIPSNYSFLIFADPLYIFRSSAVSVLANTCQKNCWQARRNILGTVGESSSVTFSSYINPILIRGRGQNMHSRYPCPLHLKKIHRVCGERCTLCWNSI